MARTRLSAYDKDENKKAIEGDQAQKF